MAEWSDYSRFLIALIAILTPFSAIPIFLSLTAGQSPAERTRTATLAVLTVVVILAGAAVTGDVVLKVLGTSLAAFRVGGGIVLLLMALSMLSARVSPVQQSPEEADLPAGRATVGVVPLGVPLIAGPGSISTVIIEGQRFATAEHLMAVIACILLAGASLYLSLALAVPIGRRLGLIGLNIMNRLFGLLLAAIAVEIMAVGLRILLPGLAA